MVTVDVRIEASIADDLETMADARNEPAWNTQVGETELLTGEPIALGSRFRTVNRGQTYTAAITGHHRPDRVTFLVSGKSMDITGALQFADDNGKHTWPAPSTCSPRGS